MSVGGSIPVANWQRIGQAEELSWNIRALLRGRIKADSGCNDAGIGTASNILLRYLNQKKLTV